MNQIEQDCRRQIVEAGKLLYDKGLLVSTDGNLSVRVSQNEILITASGFCKGKLTENEITKVDLDGNIICGLKPARDIRMHLAMYKTRPMLKAIAHAHPPVTTGFAISDYDFSKVTLPEVVFAIGSVQMTDYALPTTEQVPVAVTKKLIEDPDCEALILANHGAVTLGNTIMDCAYKMETLEMYLKALVVAKILGKERVLSEEQVCEIKKLKQGI